MSKPPPLVTTQCTTTEIVEKPVEAVGDKRAETVRIDEARPHHYWPKPQRRLVASLPKYIVDQMEEAAAAKSSTVRSVVIRGLRAIGIHVHDEDLNDG